VEKTSHARPTTHSSLSREIPRARDVHFTDDVLVCFEDGRTLYVLLEWFPRLRDASPTARNNWKLVGRGIGIHWETLDENISVQGLLVPDVA
jgi:hypothetical protein